jgi:predicted dehydrogenase
MNSDRRSFLKGSLSLAAPLVLPAGARGANDRLAYGVIGTGSRARWLNSAFQKLGAQCVALCDVYEPHLRQAQEQSPRDATPYVDYHDLLARKDLDFVVIGTPDHQHCPNLLAGLEARKDVYLEKPMSHSLEQSRQMVEAVRKTDRIVQIGMQRRSMPFVHKAKQLVDEGVLGQISMVRAAWNWHFDAPLDNGPLPGKLDWDRFLGSAPKRPLEPRRFRWWRAYWDYSGGNMTDQGTHLMDVVQWITGAGTPKSAVCGGIVKNAEGAEVPNVFSTVFEYPGLIATWTLNYRTGYDFDWSIQFNGEKATMILDRRGCRIYGDPASSAQPWSLHNLELSEMIADRDSSDAHQKNFLECVRSRKEPNCPVEVAAAAVTGPHMANLSIRQDKKIKAAEL